MGAAFSRSTLHVSKSASPTRPRCRKTVIIVAKDHVDSAPWWLKSSKPNGNCVLVLHGIGDTRVDSMRFAPMFLNAGYSILLPDSRAHGASGGEFVTYGLIGEIPTSIGWTEWMKNAGCAVKLYGVWGNRWERRS